MAGITDTVTIVLSLIAFLICLVTWRINRRPKPRDHAGYGNSDQRLVDVLNHDGRNTP